MNTKSDLKQILARIDHRGYPAYKDTRGQYDYKDFILSIDHVQGDPFAAPSDVSVIVKNTIPHAYQDTKESRIALQDLLTRFFRAQLKKAAPRKSGSGKSGKLEISAPGQEILERTACTIDGKEIRVRFNVGFPARGRTVLSRELDEIIDGPITQAVEKALIWENFDKKQRAEVQAVSELAKDQTEARRQIAEKGLAAFVADGSILPRKSGISSRKMEGAIPFQSPESLRMELDLPYEGKITGMGIPAGITLIAGGGYHGKSTLLEALETGVYDHVAGDGREFVFTDRSAVKSRAEDGRSVKSVNISGFIQNLPNKKSTSRFSTEDASGSTSQAAGIVEAIQGGAKVLLIDEDTSAGNFMVRDSLMQEVISPDKEPIIPFIDRVRELYDKEGVSTILVAGSSGAFFKEADLILQMDEYVPKDITERAKTIAGKYGETHKPDLAPIEISGKRIPHPVAEPERSKVKSRGLDTISINREEIDMRLVEQLVDPEQMAAIGQLLRLANREIIDGKTDLNEAADQLERLLDEKPLDKVIKGRAARPRRQEILAALNRQRYMDITK